MIENMGKESFAEHVNSEFQILKEETPALTLKLVEVSGPGVEHGQEQFALLLQGPLETPIGQGIHTVRHERLGTFDLFLVPVGREREGMLYEAAFNRFVK
jgi:hypothetical protein